MQRFIAVLVLATAATPLAAENVSLYSTIATTTGPVAAAVYGGYEHLFVARYDGANSKLGWCLGASVSGYLTSCGSPPTGTWIAGRSVPSTAPIT